MLLRKVLAGGDMEPEPVLNVGDVVRVEFDSDVAYLAESLVEALNGETDLTPLPYKAEFDRDFSAGAVVAEFVVATTSGITSSLITALILGGLNRLKKDRQPELVRMPLSDADIARIRLRVVTPEPPAELEANAAPIGDGSEAGPARTQPAATDPE